MWSVPAIMEFMLKTIDKECYATVKAFAGEVCELDIYKNASKSKSLSRYMITKGYAEPVESTDPSLSAILVSEMLQVRVLG